MNSNEFSQEVKQNVAKSETKLEVQEAGEITKYSTTATIHGVSDEHKISKETESTEKGDDNNFWTSGFDEISVDDLTFKKEIHHRMNPAEDIEGLVDSIKRDDIIEPLRVQKSADEPGKFIIISGSRRAEAARQAGRQKVPCFIQEPRENVDAAHQAFVANMHRKSINPIEESEHFRRMNVEFNLTLEQIGNKYNRTKASISQSLKLLELTDMVQDMIYNKLITPAHGRYILKLDSPEEQEEMAHYVVDRKLSTSQTKTKIYRHKRNKDGQNEQLDLPADIATTEIPGVHFKSSEDMSQEVGDGQAQLIITSPPWAHGKEFEKNDTPTTIFDGIIQPVLDECDRVLSPSGVIAINLPMLSKEKAEDVSKGRIQAESFFPSATYQNYMKKKGLYLVTSVVWWKQDLNGHNFSTYIPTSKITHTCYKFVPQIELILIFRKIGKREILPSKEVRQRSHLTNEEFYKWGKDIWTINKVAHDGHPCRWPDEIPERLIRMFSYEGDTVLDPFLGSGTTVKVARDLDRIGIGYERDLKYKPVIMKTLGMIPEAKKTIDKKLKSVKELLYSPTKISVDNLMTEAEQDYQEYNPDLPTVPEKTLGADGDKPLFDLMSGCSTKPAMDASA